MARIYGSASSAGVAKVSHPVMSMMAVAAASERAITMSMIMMSVFMMSR